MDGTTRPEPAWSDIVQAAYDQQLKFMVERSSAMMKMWAAEAAKLPPLTRRQKFRRSRHRFYAKVQRGRDWVASKIAGYDVTERSDW